MLSKEGLDDHVSRFENGQPVWIVDEQDSKDFSIALQRKEIRFNCRSEFIDDRIIYIFSPFAKTGSH